MVVDRQTVRAACWPQRLKVTGTPGCVVPVSVAVNFTVEPALNAGFADDVTATVRVDACVAVMKLPLAELTDTTGDDAVG